MPQATRRLYLSVALLMAALTILRVAAVRAQSADLYPPDQWYAQYWENTSLSGAPASTGNTAAVNYRWGFGRPLEGQDTFSVRWTRQAWFPQSVQRFVATMDDGMRVWIDDQLVIDAWGMSAEHVVSKDVPISAGWHNVRVDYQDLGGTATAILDWSPISGGNTYPNWKGEYFNNASFLGAPVVVRDDAFLDFSWGYGSAALNLPADNFSARWTRTFNGIPGQYRLSLTSDDGARLYVNGQLVIDNWAVQAARTRSADYWFGGADRLRVEYFEATGTASLRVNIIPVPGGEGLLPPTPTPVPPASTPVPPATGDTVTCAVLPTASQGVVISARPLNVRAAPGTGSTLIAQLQPCSQPLLTGNRSSDGLWAEILTDNGQIGWVLRQYLQTVGDAGEGVG